MLLQTKQLKLGEVKSLAQSYTASKWTDILSDFFSIVIIIIFGIFIFIWCLNL